MFLSSMGWLAVMEKLEAAKRFSSWHVLPSGAVSMFFTERFIQDAISQPKRLEWLVKDLGGDWRFNESEDYVNQEYSFAAGGGVGRIDVIGTFNSRTKLAIVEVKSGEVGDEELQQLTGYLENWHELKHHDPLRNADEAIGILLAEGFLPLSQPIPQHAFLVNFRLTTDYRMPFEKVKDSIAVKGLQLETKARIKNSTLIRFKDWQDYLHDQSLKEALWKSANLFTQPESDRHRWILINPKSGHIAVHYKGEYVACIFVSTHKSFVFGYGSKQDQIADRWPKVTPDDMSELKVMERDIAAIMDRIDQRLASSIPPGFKWEI